MRFFYYFFHFIEFIGVRVVKNLYGFKVHNSKTSSVHCIVCSPPQVESPSITIYPPIPSSFPLLLTPCDHHIVVHVHECFLFLLLNHSTHLRPPLPATWSCQPALYLSIFLVSSVCSLNFTYEWNHMLLIFLWLAHFTKHNVLQVHLFCHKG